MPRATTKPEIMLALSPTATARALGIPVRHVTAALDSGALFARVCGNRKRISVVCIQNWFETWPLADRSARK